MRVVSKGEGGVGNAAPCWPLPLNVRFPTLETLVFQQLQSIVFPASLVAASFVAHPRPLLSFPIIPLWYLARGWWTLVRDPSV